VRSDSFLPAIVILTLLLSATAHAGETRGRTTKNLGTVGITYPVVEPDVNVQLRDRAIKKSAEEQRLLLKRRQNYQPANLHHLPRATGNRTFLVDMTYTLDHDLSDGKGTVLYPRGYTFNPLDYVPLSGGLIVIDGADPDQIKWFRATPYAQDHRLRLLITGGYAATLVKLLGRPVFYLTDDIATRLHLKAVPTLVMQKEDKLQVREFAVPSERNDAKD